MPVRHAMSDPHNKASSAGQTHFGYQTVDERDKARRVADVFDSVASKYDVMNDFMSLGMHRAWKRFTLAASGVRQGDRVLDIAGGSGDLAFGMAELAGAQGEVWLSQRPTPGVWAGLYCFEMFGSMAHLESALAQASGLAQDLEVRDPIKQVLTHKDLHLHPVLARVNKPLGATGRWIPVQQALGLGLPAPIKVLLQNL